MSLLQMKMDFFKAPHEKAGFYYVDVALAGVAALCFIAACAFGFTNLS
jgi:hypothetical protein